MPGHAEVRISLREAGGAAEASLGGRRDGGHAPARPSVQLETRGIRLVPQHERRGRPRDLLFVWAAPMVSVLNFTIGASLIFMGLELWQAMILIVVGNLPWILTGVAAAAGPAAGTASSAITRAVYGIRGNSGVMVVYGGLISAVFLALNWLASTYMGAEIVTMAGLADSGTARVAVTIVVSVTTVLVAVYGHGLITRAYGWITGILLVIFVLVTAVSLTAVDWGFRQPEPLQGIHLWVVLSIGFAVLASTPLSFSNSPDMARYLPQETPRWRIAIAIAAGGALPCIVFTAVGALLATAMSPVALEIGVEHALLGLLPAWLGVLFVLGVVLNTVALNAMTTYTASMVLQAIGLPMRRTTAAVAVGLVATGLTLVLVFSTGLLEAVNLLLQLLIVISAPTMTLLCMDALMRRYRYDGPGLLDATANSPYWGVAGCSPAGLTALLAGMASGTLALTTELGTGPLSAALGGLDLSVPVSAIVAGAVYATMTRGGRRMHRWSVAHERRGGAR
ncbi:nitrate reductase [Nesterenkonia sp. PF2B19]|nr:nitrate reductase [Nesterenkonia sp. PF2B19]